MSKFEDTITKYLWLVFATNSKHNIMVSNIKIPLMVLLLSIFKTHIILRTENTPGNLNEISNSLIFLDKKYPPKNDKMVT